MRASSARRTAVYLRQTPEYIRRARLAPGAAICSGAAPPREPFPSNRNGPGAGSDTLPAPNEPMEFLDILTLSGPNFWSRRTVIEAWVDLGDLRNTPSTTAEGLYERLTTWLPGLWEHRCGVGEYGGFLSRVREGTYAAHILEHVTIELQTLAGTPVGFGKARETSTPGVYKVAIRYEHADVGRACLLAARDLVLAAFHGTPFDVAATVERLHALADDVCLGPSTGAIVSAAQARGIPTMRLTTGSLVQLGQGACQRRIWTAESDGTGAIAEVLASDKDMTKRLLQECGLPIPEGRSVRNPADAWAAAQEIGPPVVVKPLDANHGRAVFTNLSKQSEIETAYGFAAVEGTGVIVERFVPGNEHRLLVVGHRLIAAARGEAACIVGDGHSTIEELVASQLNADPRRGLSDEFPLNFVELDAVTYAEMGRQGYPPGSVPRRGVRVLVQRNGNVAFDVTDEVHPDTAAVVARAARVIGLDIAGIDLVTEDISKPLGPQRGAIVEVNAGPALHMHLKPATGQKRPVGEAIVDHLFPGDVTGRIPIVCVTGGTATTRIAHMITSLLQANGSRVGLGCALGSFVQGRPTARGPGGDAASARALLMNPLIDTAVFESALLSIVREGLAMDRCDVAVVTRLPGAEDVGQRFIETDADVAAIARCPVDIVPATGTAVLQADDPLVAAMAELCAGSVILWTATPQDAALQAHVAAGGRAVSLQDGQVVLRSGSSATPVFDATGCADEVLVAVLASSAAVWALGILPNDLTACLKLCTRPDHDGLGA